MARKMLIDDVTSFQKHFYYLSILVWKVLQNKEKACNGSIIVTQYVISLGSKRIYSKLIIFSFVLDMSLEIPYTVQIASSRAGEGCRCLSVEQL